jgi:hypothetical protein
MEQALKIRMYLLIFLKKKLMFRSFESGEGEINKLVEVIQSRGRIRVDAVRVQEEEIMYAVGQIVWGNNIFCSRRGKNVCSMSNSMGK